MSDERFIITYPEDARIVPVLDGLFAEYRQRYGDYFAHRDPEPQGFICNRTASSSCCCAMSGRSPPAFKRYDATTAELKRIWTDKTLRRQGLARRVLHELEQHAQRLGYREVLLTTGFRQPEAVGLYLSEGYQPQFDTQLDLNITACRRTMAGCRFANRCMTRFLFRRRIRNG